MCDGDDPWRDGRACVTGSTVITDRAIADIVGWTVLECYGVVGMASPNLRLGVASLLSRDRLHQGIKVEQTADGCASSCTSSSSTG